MKPAGPIVITGFMGCGKTEVARALAGRLGLAMLDLDTEILKQQGRTVAQLIVEDGEPAFRAIETDTLRALLQTGTASVIALGGGAWITDENRKLIGQHNGVSVWLDTPFAVCWQRIESSSDDRPLGRTREQAERLFQLRQPVYQLATIPVPVMAHEHLDSIVARLEVELAKLRHE
jgi:shikimate kinase